MIKPIQLKNLAEEPLAPITLVENVKVGSENYSIEEMISDCIEETMAAIYPIGSLYFSTTNINPSTFIVGTTWEAYGQGKMLRNAGTITDAAENTETYALGQTGGEYKHTITINEMTEHRHRLYAAQYYQGSSNPDYGYSNAGNGMNLSFAGKGVPRNNTQPSITMYIWRRLT